MGTRKSVEYSEGIDMQVDEMMKIILLFNPWQKAVVGQMYRDSKQ